MAEWSKAPDSSSGPRKRAWIVLSPDVNNPPVPILPNYPSIISHRRNHIKGTIVLPQTNIPRRAIS
ncbi:hypothetical protein L484_003037 [Morus notabilis]|uniref:Uncharacterized protein n=1 Tax=Morus notabilis TaxID=981085 RepID=W9R2W0_9ROSA|nr:hypothetical protein L484_003037 [Morus notabilis]